MMNAAIASPTKRQKPITIPRKRKWPVFDFFLTANESGWASCLDTHSLLMKAILPGPLFGAFSGCVAQLQGSEIRT
jgi:hypothetical protein